jgi:hypothetical protein
VIFRFVNIGLLIISSITGLLSQHNQHLPSGSINQVVFNLHSCPDSSLKLPNQFIIYGSETVVLDSFRLRADSDYTLNARFGILSIKWSAIKHLFADSSLHTLKIFYKSLPFNFKSSYQHRIPVDRIDTSTGEKVSVAQTTAAFSFDDIFNSNLQKSGSIVRGFTIGSNRDLSLNSGFRMQMSGNLTNDIDIVAALTDENTPIQPEGTTQTLQEVDKVFVDIRSSNFGATIGDFNLNLSGNEFGNFNRKLQGAEGTANYRSGSFGGDILLLGASTRGKFTTNQFQGLDGVQGPYQLTGENNNRSVIVVAGTERVYVNGERMSRGENSDYIIDYATSEITFTPRRLITRGSRIVVDFEYNDRQFNRNLFTAKSGTNLFNDKWHFNAMFVQEGDNEKSPVEATLSDTDKAILRQAGSDRSKAVKSGVELVGVGKGQYRRVDSTLSTPSGRDTLLRMYVYAPEDTLNAIYSISFTNVGLGKGDYKKISIGHYEFAGIKQGSYDPIRFLPLPQSRTFINFDISGNVADNFKLSGEYALMKFDPNKFSSKDDNTLNGSAMKFALQYSPQNVQVGKIGIGSFNIAMKERFIDRRFVSLDRINDVEFGRKWNVTDSLAGDEELREGTLLYQPVQAVNIGGGIGWMKRGDNFSTNRYNLSAKVDREYLPRVDYMFENIISHNASLDVNGNWIRQGGIAEYGSGILIPRLKTANEFLSNRSISQKDLKEGSYNFNQIIPGLSIGRDRLLSFDADIGWWWDDSVFVGKLQRASKTISQNYGAQLREWKSISSRFDLTIQNRKFTDQFKQRKNIDVETILLRWQSQINPLNRGIESDWFYELATERSAKLERVFQRVPKGTGNYIYIGDVNRNHLIDQPDFTLSRFDGDYVTFTVPGDQLIPVIDLKASARIRFNPDKIISKEGWLNKAITTLSTETYYRVEEKSTEPDRKQIYFLHLSKFLSDKATIIGSNLYTQDVYFKENDPEFSLRFRYTQRRGLTQYALQNERVYQRERSCRMRWQLVQDISNQLDYVNKTDALLTDQISYRARIITSNALVTDWSYRPEQQIEFGFKLSAARAINFDTTAADMNDQSVRIVYSFENHGQARAEFIREEVNISKSGVILPYELTDGRINGKTWLWNFSLEYQLTKFIQATINYNGRSESKRPLIHIGKAEVRAFF